MIQTPAAMVNLHCTVYFLQLSTTMKRSEFNFALPDELIAQFPPAERDGARLMVVDAQSGSIAHTHISRLPESVPEGAICVPNDVKVRRARLILRREGGGEAEALLLKCLGDGRFEALLRPAAKLKPGKTAYIVNPAGGSAVAELTVEASLDEGLRIIRLRGRAACDWEAVDSLGHLPLPPYIRRLAGLQDDERYQTVFHSSEGEAVAAPTAGLHFTPELISELEQKKCLWMPVRLHVGLGTFRPMTAEDIEGHSMHSERYQIPEKTARELENALRVKNRDVLAIGTTSLRALESAWDGAKLARSGNTDIFIRPGHKIAAANHLLTNFHLPESTLFVLVSALLGLGLAHEAYQQAIKEKYRFFSYGDAMLIMNVQKPFA
jgi:S-adenosylmethionine:tRNA ribosyltransferase-isomerase